ncbi:MAG: hypothetical protein HQL87_04570 [Magnetococcales bacterium]|nr:hypothetical protein [Magnetococcales bacterium]
MLRLVHAVYRLHHLPAYQERVAAELPAVARFDPGHEAVMMGYDFHLTPDGPRLIEVNTNAGGALLACRAYHPRFPMGFLEGTSRYLAALRAMFAQEMALFSAGRVPHPRRVIILDEEPEKQFLAEEMTVMRDLFLAWGVEATLADPGALHMSEEGVFWQGKPVDLIYNRHCDFYLESPALAGLRAAYLAGRVCLTPNPHSYGLLADKRRLILWSDETLLRHLGMTDRERATLGAVVPFCRLLAQMEPESVWLERKRWVFKPVTAFGSRGVLLGDSISRQRFQALDLQTTLVQEFMPPSRVPNTRLKMDWRLFVYRNELLGVAPRLYQGQVTNFREPGSGYAPVRLSP